MEDTTTADIATVDIVGVVTSPGVAQLFAKKKSDVAPIAADSLCLPGSMLQAVIFDSWPR